MTTTPLSSRAMGTLKEDLTRRVQALEETHISLVFLDAEDVYKVKKPVDLGFLDFSTLARRHDACEAEVRLNRRLAPGVYLGVVPVTRDRRGEHRLGGDGEVVDWAVHMRRLPAGRRADHLLGAGRLDTDDVDRIARHVADFHHRARSDGETARFGTVEAIRYNVRENFRQTRESVDEHLRPEEAAEIESWQLGFLEAHAARFAARIDADRVRDGHGDLRLEHVYLNAGEREPVTIIDCIEFNERFRYADVAADVAFLSMDLAWHGRVDLAERFLATYARATGDYDLYPLIDFYESYRAYVRGKVAAILAADETAGPEARERAAGEARRYFLLALASERRSLLPPAVVAVGGMIASGKSTLADALAHEMAAPVIDSDRTRKQLIGVEETARLYDPAFAGAYTPAKSEAVYDELLRRAAEVLASGRPVILDASFRSRAYREAARRLARDHDVPFHLVECRAPLDTLKERLRRRARQTGVSDGRLEILADFAARWEPVDELDAEEHLPLDTTRPIAESLARLGEHLPTWPAGLTE